jgi:hypothetical protein
MPQPVEDVVHLPNYHWQLKLEKEEEQMAKSQANSLEALYNVTRKSRGYAFRRSITTLLQLVLPR